MTDAYTAALLAADRQGTLRAEARRSRMATLARRTQRSARAARRPSGQDC